MSYYNVLGLESTATKEDIKNSFRKLIKQFHPDKGGEDLLKCQEIIEAYKVLTNKDLKQVHDEINNCKINKKFKYTENINLPPEFNSVRCSQCKCINDISGVITDDSMIIECVSCNYQMTIFRNSN